jgi:hypothetical protein|eukprot:COSAG01_NODE_2628_length_7351_cov_3.274645_6_plen_101_part_00
MVQLRQASEDRRILVLSTHLGICAHRAAAAAAPPSVRASSGAQASSIRVRVEIMGSQKCGTVGKSQSVLMRIDPMISTRTRTRIYIRYRRAVVVGNGRQV